MVVLNVVTLAEETEVEVVAVVEEVVVGVAGNDDWKCDQQVLLVEAISGPRPFSLSSRSAKQILK